MQTQAEPIGTTVDAIRDALSWLGKCNRDQAGHSMHLVFKFTPEADAAGDTEAQGRDQHARARKPVRHQAVSLHGGQRLAGKTEIASFEPEELFGTKLRALLQRRKNRDLFDLHHGLQQLALDTGKLMACFDHYLALEGNLITRAVAEQRMLEKLTRSLTEDIAPLLPAGVRFNDDDAMRPSSESGRQLIAPIKGDAWKLTDKVVAELRERGHPTLLRGLG